MPNKDFHKQYAVLSFNGGFYQQSIASDKKITMTKEEMKKLIISYKDSALKDFFNHFLDNYSRYEIYSLDKTEIDNNFANNILEELNNHKILIEIY